MLHRVTTPGRRDPFTAAHWNGAVVVTIHPPPMRLNLPDAPALARALFGRELMAAEWADLVGAPDGATVGVLSWRHEGGQAARLEVTHRWYAEPSFRFAYRDDDGRTAVYNESLRVHQDAPRGVGTRVLAHQVRGAQRIGVAYLTLDAEGRAGSPFNGYYTWARLGFNGPIPERARAALAAGAPELQGAADILDLLALPGGVDWWRRHGSTFAGVFDLRPGSRSLATLARYTETVGISL
jgi:hypothetical protein